MPEQCMAIIKPPMSTRSHRCPALAMLGEVYCPIHMVLSRRVIERARKHRKLLRYYRKGVMD